MDAPDRASAYAAVDAYRCAPAADLGVQVVSELLYCVRPRDLPIVSLGFRHATREALGLEPPMTLPRPVAWAESAVRLAAVLSLPQELADLDLAFHGYRFGPLDLRHEAVMELDRRAVAALARVPLVREGGVAAFAAAQEAFAESARAGAGPRRGFRLLAEAMRAMAPRFPAGEVESVLRRYAGDARECWRLLGEALCEEWGDGFPWPIGVSGLLERYSEDFVAWTLAAAGIAEDLASPLCAAWWEATRALADGGDDAFELVKDQEPAPETDEDPEALAERVGPMLARVDDVGKVW